MCKATDIKMIFYPRFENEKFLEVGNGLFTNNTDFTRTLFTYLVYLAVVLATYNILLYNN